MAIVELKNVSRVYTSGDHELKALDGVNLSLDEGKFVVILGPSGAGKSTLLNLLGGLDSPTSGTITVCGNDISTLTQNELADYRAETVGFVFQFYNLIPTLTVHENVTLVKEIVKNPLSATKMLEEVGLADHAKNFPSELSGGEQQRVSIARAIAKNPKVYLFDDSFSALDYKTDVTLRRALKAQTDNATVIIVAQRISTVLHANQILVLDEGRLVGKGTHAQLMVNCPEYQEIARSQLSQKELALDTLNTEKEGE